MSQARRKFVQVNELQFINEFKKHEILYNSLHPEYRSSAKREEAWHVISSQVGISLEDCRRRWRSMRDAYQKAVKADLDDSKKWMHFDLIHSFYEPYSGATLKKKVKKESNPIEEFVFAENLEDNTNPQDYLAEDENEVSHIDNETFDYVEEQPIENNHTIEYRDSDEAFLMSCSAILKRLPNKKNAIARLKIQQILFELEFDDKYCPNS